MICSSAHSTTDSMRKRNLSHGVAHPFNNLELPLAIATFHSENNVCAMIGSENPQWKDTMTFCSHLNLVKGVVSCG